MDSFVGRVLSAMIVPIVILAMFGLLFSCVSGKGSGCPVDPVTKKGQCSKYRDHEAWSRATAAEM